MKSFSGLGRYLHHLALTGCDDGSHNATETIGDWSDETRHYLFDATIAGLMPSADAVALFGIRREDIARLAICAGVILTVNGLGYLDVDIIRSARALGNVWSQLEHDADPDVYVI